jgi:hypothetical protein
MFPERVISLRGELPCPTRSPDFSACGYFLWWYLKAEVYTTGPRTIEDLNIAIRKQISRVPGNMARRAHLRARVEGCVRSDGQELSDELFETE